MKAALISAAVLAACGPATRGGDDFASGDAGSNTNGNGNGSGSGTASMCSKMDIVFVVDDSGSMSEEQTNLASNFPMFASILSTYTTMDGTPIDFRVGVTTTGRNLKYDPIVVSGLPPITLPDEHGPNGAFEHQSGCGTTPWLDNTDSMLSHDLSCRAKVGTGGASQEMPLLMAKRAVSDRVTDGTQAGFIRSDALLAVVMITDEDDQSNTDDNMNVPSTGGLPINWNPSDEVQFFDTLKGNRTRWAAAAIAGDGDCMSSFGSAANGARLKQFVNLANSSSTQAVFSSICDADLSIGLKKALDTFQNACGAIIF
jgi:hypothetical protein